MVTAPSFPSHWLRQAVGILLWLSALPVSPPRKRAMPESVGLLRRCSTSHETLAGDELPKARARILIWEQLSPAHGSGDFREATTARRKRYLLALNTGSPTALRKADVITTPPISPKTRCAKSTSLLSRRPSTPASAR